MREMFVKQEQIFLEKIKDMKANLIKELKQSEQIQIYEVTQRLRQLDLYLDQLNEYQESELKKMRDDHDKFQNLVHSFNSKMEVVFHYEQNN